MKKDNKNEQLKESLSAVMDGEANEDDLHDVLANFHNKKIQSVAKRYQLIGDVLRNNKTPPINIDLSDRVAEVINKQPNFAVTKSLIVHNNFQWVNHISKYAFAASFVLAVLVGAGIWKYNQPITTTYENNSILLSDAGADGYSPKVTYGEYEHVHEIPTAIDPQQQKQHVMRAIDKQVLKRFKAYSFQHAEEIDMKSMQGMLPFVRAVKFQLY